MTDNQLNAIREKVFDCSAVVSVLAASFSYDVRVGEPAYRRTLDELERKLDEISAELEPQS